MKYKQISFYAFRDNRGATGGPGGVLYLQKTILGKEYKGIKLRYVFRTHSKLFRKIFKKFFVGAVFQVFLKETLRFGNYYIVNEIASAYALALLHKPYSLVYHNQGPIIEEKTNFGEHISKMQRWWLNHMERKAFKNAKSVHFPAKGAENMFFNSRFCTCSRQECIVGNVLLNTVDVEPLNSVGHNDALTFMSVGTLTAAKGQDQTIKFLKRFLNVYKKPIKYIVVGSGPLAEQLLSEYNDLKNHNPLFDFEYHAALPHDDILHRMQEADVYIMLHRISIFDMATLEAMAMSCAIILSNVGGNVDFNVNDNVLLVGCDDYDGAAKKFSTLDIEQLQVINKLVFEKYFSSTSFKAAYLNLLNQIVNE